MPRLTLYGIDHTDYGRVHTVAQADGRSAAAISVGGEYVRLRKGDLEVPNEDACCIWDEGPRTLLAVSDGHTGHWASHGLIEFLQEQPMPSDALALLRLLRSLADDGAPAPDEPKGLRRARATLLLALLDRERGHLTGLCLGDSSALLVRPGLETALRLTVKDDDYASPWDPPSLDPRRAREWEAEVRPGDLVLLCSDGIDECCYGEPERSLDEQDLARLSRDEADLLLAPEQAAHAIASKALTGIRNHPGGQDNSVVAITRV